MCVTNLFLGEFSISCSDVLRGMTETAVTLKINNSMELRMSARFLSSNKNVIAHREQIFILRFSFEGERELRMATAYSQLLHVVD